MKTTITPMMSQYCSVKQNYQDMLLFYRMGDFYELFFDDAVIAAPILNIVLTKRGSNNSEEIPMCGIPYHALMQYTEKLLDEGYKIAICEQLESPEEAKKRGGYKAVVKRDVVRVLTPGTILEDNLLDAKTANNLISIVLNKEQASISSVDISTGKIFVISMNFQILSDELNRLNPTEIIVSQTDYKSIKENLREFDKRTTVRVDALFEFNQNKDELCNFYHAKNIESFGDLSKSEIISLGSLIGYLKYTHKDVLPQIDFPKKIELNNYMKIDATTMRHLEIISSSNGSKSTLLNVIDHTKTSFGARMLKSFVQLPLKDANVINARLNTVEFFYNHKELTDKIREILSHIPDIERIIIRITAKKAGPRDLKALSSAFKFIMQIQNIFNDYYEQANDEVKSILKMIHNQIVSLMKEIDAAITPEVPITLDDGGFINRNYDAVCDKYQELMSNSENIMNELKEKYRKLSGVNNLKIEYSKQMGFYIEATPQHATKLMGIEEFKHRQTLVSCVRFITDELAELEKELLSSKERLVAREIEIFYEISNMIISNFSNIAMTAEALARIDIFTNFAYIATKYNYSRPTIDNSNKFIIKSGRHLVVEQFLKNQKSYYQPNDLYFDDNCLMYIITGPNMGGKSTYLRQNAIIAIMAHIGSYVPAEYAHIGIIDAVFARVGASDDLAKGNSTFMVEMSETATILKNSTSKSLIIIDELGRGTSTYDGIAIASACAKYIHNAVQAKCLFATHYFEITELENSLTKINNYHVEIDDTGNKITFLHKVSRGVAPKSYGIHAAKLSGMPKQIIKDATQIMNMYENSNVNSKQISLKLVNESINDVSNDNEALNYINNLQIDELSPKQAIEELYKIKQMLN